MHDGLEAPSGIEHHPAIDAMAAHDLATVEGIQDAMRSVGLALEGFVPPTLHGSGVLTPGGAVQVEMVNKAGHDFPAMLLAALCDYRSGERAIEMSVDQVERAVKAMAPAEACSAYQHPNIAAWRRIASHVRGSPGSAAVAVFSPSDTPTGRNRVVDAFARALAERGP